MNFKVIPTDFALSIMTFPFHSLTGLLSEIRDSVRFYFNQLNIAMILQHQRFFKKFLTQGSNEASEFDSMVITVQRLVVGR